MTDILAPIVAASGRRRRAGVWLRGIAALENMRAKGDAGGRGTEALLSGRFVLAATIKYAAAYLIVAARRTAGRQTVASSLRA